jgi:hypothetical protein
MLVPPSAPSTTTVIWLRPRWRATGALKAPPLGVTVTAASPLPMVTFSASVVPVTVIVRVGASEPLVGEVIASSGTVRVLPVA